MQIKRLLIIFLGLVLITASAACVKPASKAPSSAVTATPAQGTFPVPGTSDVMGQLESFATQTAIALSGGVPSSTQAPDVNAPTPAGTSEAPVAGAATPTPEAAQATEAPAAPQATKAPYPTLTPGIPKNYTLQKGEFIYCIARRFNVDPGELLSINGLGQNSIVYAGLSLKKEITALLKEMSHKVQDFGCSEAWPIDYPDVARPLAEAVARGEFDRGILICGTGVGMSISANKVRGVRAALCHDIFSAHCSREHNDANILCLGQRVIGVGPALDIVEAWVNAEFSGEERHARRVQKIGEIECGAGSLQ